MKEIPIPRIEEESIPIIQEEPIPIIQEEPIPIIEEEPIPIIEGDDWNSDSLHVVLYIYAEMFRNNNNNNNDPHRRYRVEIMRNLIDQLFNVYPNDPNTAALYSYTDLQELHAAIDDALTRETNRRMQQGGKRRTRRNSRKRKTRKHKVKNNKK